MFFKECPTCHYKWEERNGFLSDPYLSLVGYQVNYGELKAGFFLFNHDTDECGTSMAVEAGQFTDMHEGPIFETRHTVNKNCPGYCRDDKSLDPCYEKCECAYVRDVIQRVKTWPKD